MRTDSMKGVLLRRSAGLGGLLGGLSGTVFVLFLFPPGYPIGFLLGVLGGVFVGLRNAVVIDEEHNVSHKTVDKGDEIIVYLTSLRVTIITVNAIYIPIFFSLIGR